ncbi:DUF5683 domain-containing protein [Flavobacteriaceae bacterium]|nr:DUF5683 domain-containing protein [Flavobacteriaceae bacterium]MDC3300975.1 DUF5683 domain-containing protein [Flavobacteriaceae bacterium]
MINRFSATLFCLFICLATQAQSNKDELDETARQNKKNTSRALDPLRPAKAAFYSAVLPGLGQAYNKKYWKIPIVYAAIGTGFYFYLDNNKLYKQYRNAYKRRLAGFTDDEFYGPGDTPFLSDEALIRAQRTLKRNKELSMLVTVGLYVLNIIEANVDAHLLQYNLDENLALKPFMDFNNPNYTTQIGLSLNIKF